MNEIDSIRVKTDPSFGAITGISFNCCNNSLLLSLEHAIVEFYNACGKAKILLFCDKDKFWGVLSLCPGFIAIIMRNNKYSIDVFDCKGNLLNSFCISGQITIKNLIFNPCKKGCQNSIIEAFILKNHCYPYIATNIICPHDLNFAPCCCNYDICDKGCCHKEKPSCHRDACADVIESIALIEAAISHILNAEGEKIQKVLKETDDIDKILCVNREVNRTIVNATHLEHVLHDKLNTLSTFRDFDCDKTCNSCD